MPLDQLRAFSENLELHWSLYLNEHSMVSARLSLGSVLELSDAVASRRIRNGFAVVWPPGHHAEPDRGMGFCLFNNVAVATRWLQQRYKEGPNKIKRVLIVDWDVHHGNGTQSAFWDDADVLYVSLHRYENGQFYPSSTFGNYDQVGGPTARGTSVNIPWPCGGMDDGDYMHAFQHVVLPVANEFAPDFVFISAGFDAAHGDLLGGCHISPVGYAHMTHQLAALAGGRLAVVLEGGYTLEAIANSALAVTRVILGDAPKPLPAGTAASTVAANTITQVARVQAHYWQCFKRTSIPAPPEGVSSLALSTMSLTTRARQCPGLVPVPLGDIQLPADTVLASPNIMIPGCTIVFFCHDSSALYMDDSPSVTNGSDWLYALARGPTVSVIDVEGQLPLALQPLRTNTHVRVDPEHMSERRDLLREAVLYVWDNFVALSTDPVLLVGYGHACDAVMHLVTNRAVRARVKGIINVHGHNMLPLLPKHRPELRDWFTSNSLVICPKGHPRFADGDQRNSGKRLGNPQEGPVSDPTLLLKASLDKISQFIKQRL